MHKLLSLLSFTIITLLFPSEIFAAYDSVKVGKILYEVSYGDDGPLSATAIRFEGDEDDQMNPTTSITIPDFISYNGKQCPVTAIEDNAFYYNSFKNVTLGNNLHWIGEHAFHSSYVDKLVLPASLTNVYAHGIPYCTELFIEDSDQGIAFVQPGGLTTTGQDFNLENVKTLYLGRNINSKNYRLFKSVSSLTIGEKVTYLADYLFSEAKGLTFVELPAKLEKIGEFTFKDVPITSIVIPATVTKIGWGAFFNTSLNSIRFEGGEGAPGLYADTYAFGNVSFVYAYIDKMVGGKLTYESWGIFGSSQASLQNVEFGNNVIEVTNSIFKDCYRLDNVTLGSNIKIIESDAFNGCAALSSITLPESMENIGGGAFGNCASLSQINLPDGISNIGDNAFSGCASLTEVHIPAKLDKLRWSAFNGCTSLRSVDFGGPVNLIEENVFVGCTSLGSISLPEGLERIQSNAFTGCTSLAKVEFPSTFKTFQCSTDNVPFKECNAIREVVCHGSIPAELGYGSSGLPFEDEVYKNATLSVPDESIDTYKRAKCWQPFYKITDVSGIAGASNALTVRGGRIVSTSGEAFAVTIVGADGMVLYVGPATETPVLSPGLYLAAPEGSPYSKFIVR